MATSATPLAKASGAGSSAKRVRFAVMAKELGVDGPDAVPTKLYDGMGHVLNMLGRYLKPGGNQASMLATLAEVDLRDLSASLAGLAERCRLAQDVFAVFPGGGCDFHLDPTHASLMAQHAEYVKRVADDRGLMSPSSSSASASSASSASSSASMLANGKGSSVCGGAAVNGGVGLPRKRGFNDMAK